MNDVVWSCSLCNVIMFVTASPGIYLTLTGNRLGAMINCIVSTAVYLYSVKYNDSVRREYYLITLKLGFNVRYGNLINYLKLLSCVGYTCPIIKIKS